MQPRNQVSAQASYYIHNGDDHCNKKNYAAAMLAYNQALAIDPAFKQAYNNRATVFYQQGKFQEAISDFSQALMLGPKYVAAYYNRAFVYYNIKEFQKSISDCTQALMLDPKFELAYLTRGCAYSAKGMIAQALSDFIHLLMINPKRLESIYNRLTTILKNLNENATILYAEMKQLNDTKQMELLAMCLNKNNPIGKIYYNNEQFLKNMAAYLLELNNKYFIEEIKKIADVGNKIILLKTCLDHHSFLGKKFITEYNKNSKLLMEMIALLRKLDEKSYTAFTCVTSSGVITNIGFFDKPKPKPIQGNKNVVEEVEDYRHVFNNL